MFRQIELLLGVQWREFLGRGAARWGSGGRGRLAKLGMVALICLVAAVVCAYVGLVSYGLIRIGAGDLAVLLLALVVSLTVLAFTTLRAGAVLFDLGSYERLITMPLRPTAIAASRFLSMYVFDAALALLVLLPGAAVYGAMVRPGFAFYSMMLLGALALPAIPMTVGGLLGAAVYGLSARMRHKNLAAIALSVLALLAVLAGVTALQFWDGSDGARILNLTRGLFDRLAAAYPPAGWFARCVLGGNIGGCALFLLGSAAVLSLAAALVGRRLQPICALLGAHALRADFRLDMQRRRTLGAALFWREFRRYFASPVYVTNTLTGNLLAVLMCVALRIAGARGGLALLPVSMDALARLLPLVLAAPFLLSPSSCSAISMEGRQFWIVKSLPVPARAALRAKIEVNLALALPCWALCEGLLLSALRPAGAEAAWLVLLPLGYILWGAVLGLWINLRMPMLNWESERQPVKQGRAVVFAMLAGLASVLLPGVALILLPGAAGIVRGLTLCALIAGAALIWRACGRVRLEEIE